MILNRYGRLTLLIIFLMNSMIACDQSSDPIRRTRSLDGTWQLAQTNSFEAAPKKFAHTIAVPGLIDMAKPAFETEDNQNLTDKVYWYRRTFSIKDSLNDRIQLKINKAKYHTKVYLNGKYVGENVYSFTQSVFDIKKYLNDSDKSNELIIGVGSKNMLPDTVVKGNDFEKTRYIPGIYDEVKIIQSGYPFISNVQIAPKVKKPSIQVQAHLSFGQEKSRSGKIRYIIKELNSGKEVKKGAIQYDGNVPDFTVAIPNGHFWSPEDPFLYTLELRTKADSKITRFGLRSFEFKKNKPYGFLNQKPYYLRGTNVNIYRFFEDSARGSLPWNDDWVIKLIKSYKEMHWNSARFCIGFPPERWYEIADSLGFMIQDEYPIWWGRNPKKDNYTVKSKYLAGEYKAWMKERWNHPSVIIWDAQNESVTKETGKAIRQVRSLDLSNRPWNNGWAPPGVATDPVETHPYLFIRYRRESTPSPEGPLKDLLSDKKRPDNGPSKHMPAADGKYYHNPIIINEYGWLWLNRDGSTTTLTDKVYQNITDDSLTTSQRRELYARYLGILTEYWRAYRTSAGVLHFCGLGYSRADKPRGQTSDNFVNVEKLKYDPYFLRYVKPAFAPVGLMIDYWDKKVEPGELTTIPVHIINDTYKKFTNKLYLEVRHKEEVLKSKSLNAEVNSNGKSIYSFHVNMPKTEGNYELVAHYNSQKEKVFSARSFKIVKH